MTLFAMSPMLLSILHLFPASLLCIIPRRESESPLPLLNPLIPPRHSSAPMPAPVSSSQIAPLPVLTVYRAHMLVMTTLSILAVDFRVFPCELVKREAFAVSLVDILLYSVSEN